MKQAIFCFCVDPGKDPVAPHVLAALLAEREAVPTDVEIDGYPVLRIVHDGDAILSVVRTSEVISHDYPAYVPLLNRHFGSADVVGLVNWHQGNNAPNSIFTIQTTGDLAAGAFGPVDPKIVRSLLLAIEGERNEMSLDSFQTVVEATHWSGVQYGQGGRTLLELKPSVIDIEIGSVREDWENPDAAKVMARALPHVFDHADDPVISLLYLGGVHFEPSVTAAAFMATQGKPLMVSHMLANQWLVSEGYDRPERGADLLACALSIKGGVDAVVFHEKLKSNYKIAARQLAEQLGVLAISHKKLKNPANLFEQGPLQ